jgi:hypothetical protein
VPSQAPDVPRIGGSIDARAVSHHRIDQWRLLPFWAKPTLSLALVQRALRAAGSTAWRLDPSDINLVFAGASPRSGAGMGASAGTL